MNVRSQNPASVTAELQLTRPPRLADAVWPYEVVLDGENAGEIRNRASIGLPISPGTHTLQIRSLHVVNRHLGLASPAATFEVSDTETAEFVCHPHAARKRSSEASPPKPSMVARGRGSRQPRMPGLRRPQPASDGLIARPGLRSGREGSEATTRTSSRVLDVRTESCGLKAELLSLIATSEPGVLVGGLYALVHFSPNDLPDVSIAQPEALGL